VRISRTTDRPSYQQVYNSISYIDTLSVGKTERIQASMLQAHIWPFKRFMSASQFYDRDVFDASFLIARSLD
jgi:hypothetical protein